eukprot:4497542-Prymnesium_polylepis.1
MSARALGTRAAAPEKCNTSEEEQRERRDVSVRAARHADDGEADGGGPGGGAVCCLDSNTCGRGAGPRRGPMVSSST